MIKTIYCAFVLRKWGAFDIEMQLPQHPRQVMLSMHGMTPQAIQVFENELASNASNKKQRNALRDFLLEYCDATQMGGAAVNGEKRRSHILANQDKQRSVKELPSDQALLKRRLEEQQKAKEAEDKQNGVTSLEGLFDDDDDF
jgi:hypothetical protein